MKIKMEAMILARRLRLSRNHITLDLGCGIGLYNVFWSGMVREQILTDISETMLRMVKDFSGNIRTNLHLINCDVRHLPIRSGCIDRCVCLGVLKHLKGNPFSTFKAIIEAEKTLKVGGMMYVNDLNIDYHVNAFMHRLINFGRRILGVFCVNVYFYRKKDFEIILTLLKHGKVIFQTYGWRPMFSDTFVNLFPVGIRRLGELLFGANPRYFRQPTNAVYLYSNAELFYVKNSQ
jgi:ubiquinone/menaquinone biosynthesis C-methylase UbiE